MPPRVSVLIPAYNAESTIEAALASILRQSCADFEVVVVNDGSTDSTPCILESIRARDERVRLIHVEQGGIIRALNTGLSACEGEFVARMDADDISHPERLRLQVEMMDARPDISVCSCLICMFPRANVLGGMERYERWLNSLVAPADISRDIFVESPVAHPSVMLRKKELIEVGGYQEHGWAEDYDLWLRYHCAGKRFAKVERTLVCWRQCEGRLTFTDGRYSLENFLRAKAHYIHDLLGETRRPVVVWGAGKTGKRLLKQLERADIAVEAVIDIDPGKIGRSLRGRPIVGVNALGEMADPFVISAVSSHAARELIREQLCEMSLAEGTDFICAA